MLRFDRRCEVSDHPVIGGVIVGGYAWLVALAHVCAAVLS